MKCSECYKKDASYKVTVTGHNVIYFYCEDCMVQFKEHVEPKYPGRIK